MHFILVTGRNEVVAKVMFLQVCVCPQGGGCLPQSMLGCQTPPQDQGEPPPRPGRENPPPPQDQGESPRDQGEPPRQTPPGPGRHPPPWEADFSIQSMSGRYTSYWNAFLFSRNYTKLADLPDLAFLCYSLALFSHAYLDISVLLIHEN